MEKIVSVLIAAHAIADFSLQTDKLALRKNKLGFLLIHAGIHAVLTYIILQEWQCWQAPVFVLVVHGLIDFVKQRWNKDTATAFAVDQIAHVLSLFSIALILVHFEWITSFTGVGYKILIILAGFIATINGSGFLIDKFVKQLMKKNDLELKGLTNGGKLIGQLERTLIFLFVFIGYPSGIGFLVAAKSILRFEEAKKQKLAEYVLIGTLLSFSLAISLAFLTKWASNF